MSFNKAKFCLFKYFISLQERHGNEVKSIDICPNDKIKTVIFSCPIQMKLPLFAKLPAKKFIRYCFICHNMITKTDPNGQQNSGW